MSLPFPQSAPLHLLLPSSPSLPRNPPAFFPRAIIARQQLFFRLRGRPPAALPATDQELLQALVGSSNDAGDEARTLPAVRSYECDLARLTLVGAVRYDQALTAAAADGGDAADEHLSSGTSTMVVETVFPGSSDQHSTVSTRLFLPAKKVKEKSETLRSSLAADILSSSPTVSKNILAMTFRQVVLQRLWSFQLSLFYPGTERNMKDIGSPRKVATDVAVSSSDARFLSSLAEAICSCALEDTERNYLGNVGDLASNNIFGWLQKPKWNCSVDSVVCIYRMPEAELVRNAKKHVDKFDLLKGKSLDRERKMKHRWWTPPRYSRLDKYGGPGFSDWTNEFIPAYRLQINAHAFKDTKLEGWQKLDDTRWEVLLTHFQMVELANILDMYYEDRFTLPDKQLSYGLITKSSNVSRNKSSPWKMIYVTLAGGFIVIFISVLAQLCWPQLQKSRKALEQNTSVSLSETDCCHLQSLEAAELEVLSISVVKKIKDALGWPGDIIFDANIGAWTGKLPHCLRNANLILHAISDSGEDTTNYSGDVQTNAELPTRISSSETSNTDSQATAQDIASFQVVLSKDGKIIGFQPTSRVAVSHWASNPLARVLYEGRKLSPGLLEPTLKISHPHKVVLIELLMSVNPESTFALARPIEQPREVL